MMKKYDVHLTSNQKISYAYYYKCVALSTFVRKYRHKAKTTFQLLSLPPALRSLPQQSVLSKNGRYLYVKNQKSACSTVTALMFHWDFGRPYAEKGQRNIGIHESIEINQWASPENKADICRALTDSSCKKFTFVRSPLSRCVSMYKNFFVEGSNPERLHHQKHLIKLGFSEKKSLEHNFDVFLEYIERCLEIDPYRTDPHFRPQFFNMMPHMVDYFHIGRVENMAKDVAFLENEFEIPHSHRVGGQLPRVNKSSASYSPTKEQRIKMEKIFRIDFEYFGY